MSAYEYQRKTTQQVNTLLDELASTLAEETGHPNVIVRNILTEYAHLFRATDEAPAVLDTARKCVTRGAFRHKLTEASRVNVRTQPRKIVFGQTEKDRYHPDSPNYTPKFTTPDAFNEHVAGAVEPHVINLVKYVAKERGLVAPNETQIKKAVNSVDWTKAAYFTKDDAPSPTKLRLFLKTFVADPLKKVVMGFPAEEVIFAVQALAMSKAMYMGIKYLIGHGASTKTAHHFFDKIDRAYWRRVVHKWR